jgi:hypothetical protein
MSKNQLRELTSDILYKENAYNFEKRLLNEGTNLFTHDKNGRVNGLDYFEFAKAASLLMKKIDDEKRAHVKSNIQKMNEKIKNEK